MSKKVFGFSLYGGNEKYCRGMTQNIEEISARFPDFEIWIYIGNDVPTSYIEEYKKWNCVRLISIDRNDSNIKCYRYFPIDSEEVEVLFSRDCDSRVNERDEWCIRKFLESDKQYHILRDHFWHRVKIPGGLCGIKKGCIGNLKLRSLFDQWIQLNPKRENTYDLDQVFLEDVLYKIVSHKILVHSNIVGYSGEIINEIDSSLDTSMHFVGNVYNFVDGKEVPEFNYYDYDIIEHINWLRRQNQVSLCRHLLKKIDITKIDEQHRSYVIKMIYVGFCNSSDLFGAQKAMKLYKYTYVDDVLIRESNNVINALRRDHNKKIIATTNSLRKCKEDEIVICYGNYLHDVNNLPASNKIYRHPHYFFDLNHDVVEFDECWNSIDQMYVLNLEDRVDRYMEFLVELCRMNAPLDRLYHYKAKKEKIVENKTLNIYLGATKNHLDVTKHFVENNFKNCVIFEDDFTFTSNYQNHKKNMKEFFKRDYDFDVCLLASSKYHQIDPLDDLLLKSYQQCTTTAGYILNRKTANKVLECFQEGYDEMLRTGDYVKYVCDRYWSKLQKDGKFFIFGEKMGYQRPVYSSITQKTNLNFD